MYYDSLKLKIEEYCKKANLDIKELTITKGKLPERWHPAVEIKIKNPHFSVCIDNIPSGCGIVLMHNFFTSDDVNEKTKPIFDAIFDWYKKANIGTFICTLGNNFTDDEPNRYNLEALGFTEIAHYDNLYHGEGDSQKLYIKSINRAYFENQKQSNKS